jgi:hypothetical protein
MTVETMPVSLRPPRQKGCLQEMSFKEFKNNDDFALLHHNFVCKEE